MEGKMKKVYNFEKLEIWQVARKLANQIYDIIDVNSFKRDFSFRDQLKRSAISSMSNIADGFMRGSNKEFIQFLFIARSSTGETKSHLYLAIDRKYINIEQFDSCKNIINELLNKINAFIKYLSNTDNKGIKFK